MREKLRDGGGESCHMRSSTQSEHYCHSESIKGGSIKLCSLANSNFPMSC
ncbi:hypothetical protein T09_6045 [Trichinella sp. T9]|nr:hypothetical protein T09_6045 [Trichinella sp. T9]